MPVRWVILLVTRRNVISPIPPGPNGRKTRIGFAGYCAEAGKCRDASQGSQHGHGCAPQPNETDRTHRFPPFISSFDASLLVHPRAVVNQNWWRGAHRPSALLSALGQEEITATMGKLNETSPPTIPASGRGRRRASGAVAHRHRASVPVPPHHHGGAGAGRRRDGHQRAPGRRVRCGRRSASRS